VVADARTVYDEMVGINFFDFSLVPISFAVVSDFLSDFP
jgi:hypothetical protein